MGSEFFRKLSIAVGVIGAILGVVLGAVLKTQSSLYGDPKFNAALMIYVWIGTIVVVLAFVALVFHFKNQETMIDHLNDLVHYTKPKDENK